MNEVRPTYWQCEDCPKCGQKSWAVPWEPRTVCLTCMTALRVLPVYLPFNPAGSQFGQRPALYPMRVRNSTRDEQGSSLTPAGCWPRGHRDNPNPHTAQPKAHRDEAPKVAVQDVWRSHARHQVENDRREGAQTAAEVLNVRRPNHHGRARTGAGVTPGIPVYPHFHISADPPIR